MYDLTIEELLDKIESFQIVIKGKDSITNKYCGDLYRQDTAISLRRVLSDLIDPDSELEFFFDLTHNNVFNLGSKLTSIGLNHRENTLIYMSLKPLASKMG